jgi:hemerythrin
LFVLANALIEAAFKRNSNPQEFDASLEKLIEHVARHFADEEAILAQHHYAGLEVHAQAHKRLIERALQLRDAAAGGGVTIGELVDFLADEVVARHMLHTDREFYPLFSPSPATLDY